MTYISYSCVHLHALEYCKKKSWSNKKIPKFIIPYSEYEYESKFSKLMSTATLPHGHCMSIIKDPKRSTPGVALIQLEAH